MRLEKKIEMRLENKIKSKMPQELLNSNEEIKFNLQ